ncbi:MAG: InlB B-repeat-containing protein [Bacteroidales bacterium]|nr:InlB B-repeat-containing protein [Bacteroidales bacterium]
MITGANAQITGITISTTADAPTNPYTVTFNAGTNGTCSTPSLTEASVGAGVTLPSCTANTNYTFVGWSTSSTPTSANAGKAGNTYKPSSNCTLYAYYTYQAPSHDAKFFVNGEQYGETQSVAEGSAITFPAEKPSIDDVVFIGWAEAEISGTQDNAPNLVSSKNMGNADANFYAVFATASGSGASGSYTLDYNNESALSSSTDWGSYGKAYEYTASDGSTWVVKGFKNKGIQLNTGKNASIKVPDCPGAISSVVVTGANVTYYFSESDYTGSNGSSIANAQGTSAIIDLSGKNVSTGYIYTSASSAVTKVVVNYGAGVTYSDYCTTVSGKATATLNIADADKNVALGYNGTKNVTISVSEAEYDGTVTIASSDENVARVTYTGTTATITYVGEGEAYISVTAPSTANYYAINVPQAIKVTATDDRQEATVAIAPETISVYNGSSEDYTVTSDYDGTISVASSKESVATVSYNEGKVTVEGKSVGNATLTISGEGTANYKPFSKDFTITVNKVVPVGIKNLRSQITATSSSAANDYEAEIVDAVVTYVSNGSTPTIYIEDDEAGVAIYAKNTGLAVGDKLNGVVSGKGYIYSGLTELTSITGFEKVSDATVPCTEVTLAQLEEDGMEAWESRRVIVKDLTITSAMSSRNATVEQNGVSIKVNEKASAGCTGDKLSNTDYVVTSIVGYFQDYNSTNQIGVWSEDDINLVEKANAQVVFDLAAGTGTSESPVAFTIGEDNTFPTAVVKDSEGNAIAGATVTYSTGNDAYISVDAETGVVTLKKYASRSNNVRVTASFAGNAEYKSATADYYLTIAKGTPVISFAEPNVEVALDGVANLAAIVDAKYGSLGVTYSSSNPAVASFADASNSTLTLNTEGTTTISAQTVGNDTWKQSNKVSYTLIVTTPSAGYAYVTLDACYNDIEGYTEPLKVVKGRTVTLPNATTTKNGYTFRGWTAAGEVAQTSTAPSLVANNYVANADVTLYPVFSKEENDGESGTDMGWVLKGLNELDLNSTVLIISTSGSTSKILSADQGSTGYFTGRDVTVEDGIVTSNEPTNSNWIISKEGDDYSFTSNSNGYLYNMGCSYSNYERWALSANGEKTYSMESLGGSPYNHSGNYVYLDNSTWRMTTNATLSKIQFFQIDEYDVPGSTTTYYVSRTMNVLELDENATEIAEIDDDEYDRVIVHRTIKAGNWNTLCLPFDMTAAQIEENFGADAEVKILTGLKVNGTSYTMNFSDCDEIGAGIPCMIRVSNAVSTITVEGTVEVDTTEDPEDSASDSSNDNEVTFVGNYAKITVPMNVGNYIISSNKFYYVDSAVTSKGFRGYFNLFSLDGSNDAKALSFSFDENTTAIENVNVNGLDDNNVFDLSGRKVVKAQKNHLYIKNGHKYLAK